MTIACAPARADDDEIFLLPERFNAIREKLASRQLALQAKQLNEARQRSAEAVQIMEGVPETLLYLASTQAELGLKDKSFANLSKAVDAGLSNMKTLNAPVFKLLHDHEGWEVLLARATVAKPDQTTIWRRPAQPLETKDGVAMINGKNTMWVPPGNVLLTLFKIPDSNKKRQVVRGQGKVGELIRRWHTEGTAAGNHGDFYDNHDRGHSNMSYNSFPQLTRIVYCEAAKSANLDWGAQFHFLFNGVVLGNSSTSLTRGAAWRSQARLIQSSQNTMNLLHNQYSNNHFYIYPEHRDYDIGHNGKGPDKKNGGYGDTYFGNVPYTITSQGSSGSDRPFMTAVAATMAAFHPDVKKKLVKEKLLVPTIQMIFRRTNKNITTDEIYLTGAAHPPVFDSKQLDTLAMVNMAHSMTPEHLPPIARFRMMRESKPQGVKGSERVFDTEGAIARVHRTTAYVRRMQLDAAQSRDANGEKLTFHWKILIGDPQRIKITPLDETGTKVGVDIAWHDRYPIAEGSKMETNRVDIACFASNGTWFSNPAILSTYFPDNDERVYEDGKLVSQKKNDNYADPILTGETVTIK